MSAATLATPPEWRVLNPRRLGELWTTENSEDETSPELEMSQALSARLSQLQEADGVPQVIFAASCAPGDGASIDLSVVTLALKGLSGDGEASGQKRVSDNDVGAGPEIDPNALKLPAGPALRLESFDLVELGPPFGAMPIFCVEYGVAMPNDERMAILTFTTIAPSDIDALRMQFAEIAETLAFS